MQPIKIIASLFLLVSTVAMSTPTLQLKTPTPTDGWLIASPQGPYSQSLELALEATDADGGASASTFWAGVMNDGACQSLQFDVTYPNGLVRGNGVKDYKAIPPNSVLNPTPSYLVKAAFPISVRKTASSPLLTLCAYNASTRGLTKLPFKVSYGQPAKSVLIQKATYSSEIESLQIQGRVVPNGRNILTGTSVLIQDVNGNLLGSGLVIGKAFKVVLSAKANPGQIMAKVVNTVSLKKPVTNAR